MLNIQPGLVHLHGCIKVKSWEFSKYLLIVSLSHPLGDTSENSVKHGVDGFSNMVYGLYARLRTKPQLVTSWIVTFDFILFQECLRQSQLGSSTSQIMSYVTVVYPGTFKLFDMSMAPIKKLAVIGVSALARLARPRYLLSSLEVMGTMEGISPSVVTFTFVQLFLCFLLICWTLSDFGHSNRYPLSCAKLNYSAKWVTKSSLRTMRCCFVLTTLHPCSPLLKWAIEMSCLVQNNRLQCITCQFSLAFFKI